MNRYRSQGGVALVMVIGFVAVLLVLGTAVALVMVNDMGATSDTTARSKAFNVAEAGLDMGMFTLSSTWPSSPPAAGTPVTLSSDLRAMLPEAEFPTSAGESFVTVTMSPGSDDSHMLLQSQANVAGKSVKLETMIVRQNVGLSSLVPGVALYSGRDMKITGTGVIRSPLDGNMPTGSVYVYKDAKITGGPDFSTVGLKVRNNLTYVGNPSFSSIVTQNDPTVPTFDAFLPQSQIDYLTQLSKAVPTSPPPAAVEVPNNGTIPNTAAAVHVKGKGKFLGGGTYTIGSLYVDGDLTVTGSMTLNIGSLYVGGKLTITGSGVEFNIDSLYVNGNLEMTGNVKLTNLGPTWVGGLAKIVASNSQCRMPLVVAQGDVELVGGATWGGDGVGDNVEPCIAVSLTGKLKWVGTSEFYGLMAAPQGPYNTTATAGWVHGSVLVGKDADLTISGFKIAYDDRVVRSIQTGSATIAKRVPGTWRQLPAE